MGSFLKDFDEWTRRNGFLDPILNFIPGYKESVAPYRHAKRDGYLEELIRTQKELVDYGRYLEGLDENEADPKQLLSKCQEILSNAKIELVFDRYSKYMDKRLLHAEWIGIVVLRTERHLLDEDVLAFAKMLQRSRIIESATTINDDYSSKHWVSQSFRSIARRCPSRDKEALRFTVDVMPYFKACMLATGSTTQVDTYANLVSDSDTESALRFLRHSDTWRSFPKDSNFRHWINEFDKRLMPALDYS